jgi:hypothetical protein
MNRRVFQISVAGYLFQRQAGNPMHISPVGEQQEASSYAVVSQHKGDTSLPLALCLSPVEPDNCATIRGSGFMDQ